MAVVAPSTHVMLCQNVPLDKTYKDTLTFANKNAQYNYFASKVAFQAHDCQYVHTEGAIRFPDNAEQVDTCNYLMFQNEGFGNKWYYAFIDRVEYAQTGMCRIWFTLDVMQTWAFDYVVHPSMVVREHVTDDSIGANLVDEGLPYGQNIIVSSKSTDMSNLRIVLAYVNDRAHDSWVDHIYSGCDYIVVAAGEAGATSIDNQIADLANAGQLDRIAGIFMVPDFISTGKTITLSHQPNVSTVDGYNPRNNKLFVYPYCYTSVTNHAGGEAIYRNEYFLSPTNISFYIDGQLSMQSVAMCTPVSYKGMTRNTDEALQLSAFPQCTWVSNNFANWLALNSKQIETGFYSQGAGFIMNAVGLSPSGVASSAMGIMNHVASLEDRAKTPPTLSGQVNNASYNAGHGYLGFELKAYQIKAEYAKMIDDYFTMYGYQVNRLKVPNINTRPSWNYVQTQKAMITGSIPFDDLSQIRNNFDRGITFWHGDWVGDYTRSNGEQGYTPPVGPVDPDPPVDPEKVTWGVPFADWQSHVTSEYGWRTNPITGQGQQFHSGIDIAYPTGTQIMAIANGTVVSETSSSGRGLYMDVKVDSEYTYRYQHLSAYDVPNGAAVTSGEYIAKVGATGDVTGPHLHLEILKNGQTVDPRPYLEGKYN